MKKYRYKEKLFINNDLKFWAGVICIVLNSIAVIWGIVEMNSLAAWISKNPMWLFNIAGIPVGAGLMGSASEFRKVRVPVSPQDEMKEDLRP